jgi:hypothetical protein
MEQPERLKLGGKARRSDASTGRKNPQALSVCSQVPPRVKQAHEKRGSFGSFVKCFDSILAAAIQSSSKRVRPFSAFHWFIAMTRALQLLDRFINFINR